MTALPDVIQASIRSVIDSTTGDYTIQWMGLTFVAREAFPDINVHNYGDKVLAEMVGSSTEWVIIVPLEQS